MRQKISVTTDSAIFFGQGERIKILLVQRKIDPFKGQWALPGGFLETQEPLENGAMRELQEETGLQVSSLTQLKTYGTPGRDPRGRTITIAFVGEVATEEKVAAADDAADAGWFDIEDLPSLAFDHDEVVQDALDYYKSKKEPKNN